jgi:hypothetical protein
MKRQSAIFFSISSRQLCPFGTFSLLMRQEHDQLQPAVLVMSRGNTGSRLTVWQKVLLSGVLTPYILNRYQHASAQNVLKLGSGNVLMIT